jgi:hypothetical protein
MGDDTNPFVFSTPETVARLRGSLDTLESFLRLVPSPWTHESPPGSPDGAWSVAMNLAHMTVYEEALAAPVVEAIVAGGDGEGVIPSADEGWLLRGAGAIAGQPLDALAARLRVARERQIRAIESCSPAAFNQPATPLWSGRNGGRPLSVGWVVTKTLQHTWEHGNSIMRVALFTPH